MARSRKMPPLFEVMRETDRKAREGAAPRAPIQVPVPPLPRPADDAPLRLSPDAPRHHDPESPDVPEAGGRGVLLQWPVVLGGAGVLVAIVAIIAMLAFNAGANRERAALLPKDGEPPTLPDRSPRPGEPNDPLVQPNKPPSTPRTNPPGPASPPTPGGASPEVFGDDPRESGKNYLIIERLMFDDAMAAATFLSQNGVPSVVVPPEGVESSDLQRQARGIWLVIARQGFTRDEFRASNAADDIKNAVVRLGRRWKQDHKGSTNFANCYWNKFGK